MARYAPQLCNEPGLRRSDDDAKLKLNARVGRSVLFCGSKCRILSFAVGAAGILCAIPEARSAPTDSPAGETCPSRDSIGVAVQALLGESRLSSEELNLVEVVDLGARYVIKVKGRVREYTDESRDCAKRARVAAVFVALTLAPPDIGASDEGPWPKSDVPLPEATPQGSTLPPAAPTPPVQPVPVPAAPSVSASPKSWTPGVEIGVSAAIAPRSDKTLFDLGGQFKFVFSSPQWGLLLGANIPTASTLMLESIRIQQARYSAILGVRFNLHTEQIRGALDICAMSALLRLRQLDLPNANTTTSVESGLHLGTVWALSGRLVSPYVGGYAEFIPATIPIAVEPRGIIGHSSAVWLGLSAGMALGSY